MRRHIATAFAVLLVVSSLGWLARGVAVRSTTPEIATPIDVEVEGRVRVRAPAGSDTSLWIPVPPTDESQRVDEANLVVVVDPPRPFRVASDERGNRFVHVGGFSGPLELTYRVPVRRNSQGGSGHPDLGPTIDEVLKGDGAQAIRFPYNGRAEEALASLESAEELVDEVLGRLLASVSSAPTPIERAVLLNEVLRRNGAYLKTGAYGQGSSLWFCLTGQGNCTDFHFTYLDVAERVDVPGKFRIGLPLSPDPTARIADADVVPGYHCWIYLDGPLGFAIDPSWESRLQAPTGTYFGQPLNDRVKLTEGTGLRLAPAIDGPPLPYAFEAYAEADGEPLSRAYAAEPEAAKDAAVITSYRFRRLQ